MSEALKISSKNVKEWLEGETGSIFIPVNERAQKLLGEMKRGLEKLMEICKVLFENSSKEIEKRNMKTYGRARALNKLARVFLERMQSIGVPEEVSYDSFREFVQETEKAFAVTEVDIKRWFPRVSPFFILDRRKFSSAFEKAKETLSLLRSFLTREYIKTKTLEETFQLIDSLLAFEGQLEDLEAQRKKNEIEIASIEAQIAQKQHKTEDLKNRESLTQVDRIGIETRALEKELKHSLRHLRKPFIKFHRSAYRKGGLTPDELASLNHYIKTPFEAFAKEELGYPRLIKILQKLDNSLSDGKIKLKRDRARKAEEALNKILQKESLKNLHERCVDTILRHKQLSTSPEIAEVKRNLTLLQEQLGKLEKRRETIESKKNVIDRTYEETMGKIRNQKKIIAKNILDFMDKRVRIE